MRERLTILIVDDHPLVRKGLRAALTDEKRLQVVGEASSGEEAVAMTQELKPDVVIMDITMEGMDGIAATKKILEGTTDTKVIILSMHEEGLFALNAFKAGAKGYVIKGSPVSDLLNAIEKVSTGERYASPQVSGDLIGDFVEVLRGDGSQDPIESLTKRERMVFDLIIEGLTNKAIGEKLFISLATVKTHRVNIMKKLGVHDLAALMKVAYKKGLIG